MEAVIKKAVGQLAIPQFRGMSVPEGADFVMNQLKADSIRYAADPKRGQYRGFAALHDLMDANMLLPFADDKSALAEDGNEYLGFANAVMDEVSQRILASAGN